MSGILDIFVGLNDLVWTALGTLLLVFLRKRLGHYLMSQCLMWTDSGLIWSPDKLKLAIKLYGFFF